ncbi:unnamed protein product [Tuber aestivum]|uniref:Uncharacterized protein n=1 Tax=Tuber aestivum TaxID=59557 RepID=A0A292PX15_9PEZI|nr:unnamed protein product [Tuber aestivum]
MSPPHTPCSKQKQRERRNLEVSILHHYHPDWSYQQIAEKTGRAKSQVHNVIKCADLRGYLNVGDAPQSGRPSTITQQTRPWVEQVIDENWRLPLRDIAEKIATEHPSLQSQTPAKKILHTGGSERFFMMKRFMFSTPVPLTILSADGRVN